LVEEIEAYIDGCTFASCGKYPNISRRALNYDECRIESSTRIDVEKEEVEMEHNPYR
jgi:hypothetical protein